MRVCVGDDSCIAMKEEEVSKKLCYVRPRPTSHPWLAILRSAKGRNKTQREDAAALHPNERKDHAQVSLNIVADSANSEEFVSNRDCKNSVQSRFLCVRSDHEKIG